jgi:hypothetical protein
MFKTIFYSLPILMSTSCLNVYANDNFQEICALDNGLCEYISFRHEPAVLDMPCSDTDVPITQTQVLEYVIENNTNMTVTFDAAVFPNDLSPTTDAITSTCTLASGHYALLPFDTCIVYVNVISENCTDLNTAAYPVGIDRQLEITPVNVPQDTFTSDIIFQIGDENSQLAYIADPTYGSNGAVWVCEVFPDGRIDDGYCAGGGPNLPYLNPTFANPIDVILNNTATKAYVANAAVSPDLSPGISVCHIDGAGNFGACQLYTDPAIDFEYSGLRLNADNSALYVTSLGNNTVAVCDVNPDGSIVVPCVHANLSYTGNAPKGRVAFDFSGETSYVANYGPVSMPLSYLSVCDDDFDYCTIFEDNTINFALGLDITLTYDGVDNHSWLYIADTNDTGYIPQLSLCEVLSDGSLEPCTVIQDYTLAFFLSAPVVNLYMNNFNGFGYIPNFNDHNVSYCQLDPATGVINGPNSGPDFCNTSYVSGLFDSPTSVWIATFPNH